MKIAAVIGDPISQSKSPLIFSLLAKACSMGDLQYSAVQIFSADLSKFMNDLRSQSNYVGLNVTVPHKEAILPLLDTLSTEATAIGAANVVQARRTSHDGCQLIGHNTDGIGVLRTLEDYHCQLKGRNAWIFGAGGAARAVAYALGSQGARKVFIQGRSKLRAERLVQEMSLIFPQTDYKAVDLSSGVEPLSLLVQCTPISQDFTFFENLKNLPLAADAAAFELIYNPKHTAFLQLAARTRLRTIGGPDGTAGLDMLLHQALGTWEIWFPEIQIPDKKTLIITLKQAVKKSLSNSKEQS
jgi:shikimate dehydrogenase